MTQYADYFMTLNKGGIIQGVAYSFPPHELLKNQVMLTYDEYILIAKGCRASRGNNTITILEQTLNSIKIKIKDNVA